MANPFADRGSLAAAIALVIGIAIGSCLPAGVYNAEFQSCVKGPLLGSTDPLLTPTSIVIPPPGGYVAWSSWFSGDSYVTSGEGSTAGMVNSTDGVGNLIPWDLWMQHFSHPVLFGAAVGCNNLLEPAGPYNEGASFIVAGPTPAGVGEQSQVPSWLTLPGYQSVEINASYGPTPLATFSWSSSVDGQLTFYEMNDWPAAHASFEPYWNGSVFVGLGLVVHLSSLTVGIPIHLVDGPTLLISGSIPQIFPEAALSINATYIFPASDDQGTWGIFAAGGSSSIALGGLVFEQTSTSGP